MSRTRAFLMPELKYAPILGKGFFQNLKRTTIRNPIKVTLKTSLSVGK